MNYSSQFKLKIHLDSVQTSIHLIIHTNFEICILSQQNTKRVFFIFGLHYLLWNFFSYKDKNKRGIWVDLFFKGITLYAHVSLKIQPRDCRWYLSILLPKNSVSDSKNLKMVKIERILRQKSLDFIILSNKHKKSGLLCQRAPHLLRQFWY